MLQLREVGKKYGPRTVLREVSLAVEPGSVILLAGANGAGKSTLLRIMAGLCRPSSGTVSCEVEPGRIGYLGHQTLIYPRLSAMENLAFWAKIHRLKKDEAFLLDVLAHMDLAAFAHEPAGTFSRGMAQRLSLARLFLLSPELILMDEPGTGLDTASRDLLYREIQAARNRGAALVWVTHSPEQDALFADSTLRLEKGRVQRTEQAEAPCS
jgi:heme exporter protein A